MTSFGRTTRQNAIWDELQEIRDVGGGQLLGPEDGDYETNGLQEDYEALVTEYEAIHAENETKG